MARDDLKKSFPDEPPAKGGNMTVLARGTPQEVAPPEAHGAGLDRSAVGADELANVAPVKGNALDRNREEYEEHRPDKPEVFAEVLETRVGVDDGVNGRVTLRAGKVVSSKHYNLARLHQQGVKLRKMEGHAAPHAVATPFA